MSEYYFLIMFVYLYAGDRGDDGYPGVQVKKKFMTKHFKEIYFKV